MKKIVIFEDTLENTVAYVKELNGMENVEVKGILLYCINEQEAKDKITELNGKFPAGIEMIPVTLWNYEEQLDRYYEDPDTLFLFDMNLVGDGSKVFENRINVMYARKKEREESTKRIWFYTTTKAEQRAILIEKFKDSTLKVKNVSQDGVELDFLENKAFREALEVR